MENRPKQFPWVKFLKNRQAGASCEADFLSSVLRTERVNADQQSGDCEQNAEKLSIRHTHHLRFCILPRRHHPVDLLAYKTVIACVTARGKDFFAGKAQTVLVNPSRICYTIK